MVYIMDYRTENENEVFKIFRRFTAVCEGEKEKATTDFARLSPSVGMRPVSYTHLTLSVVDVVGHAAGISGPGTDDGNIARKLK